MAIVAAEMVIQSPVGLGYFIWNMATWDAMLKWWQNDSNRVIGYIMNISIVLLQKRVIKWVD